MAKTIIDAMESWMAGEPVWPYDRIISEFGRVFIDWRRRWRDPLLEIDEFRKHRQVRSDYVGRFGFAIPCAELLDELAKPKRVVEVGAGSGYMTRLMRHRGIDVIGSDAAERGALPNERYAFAVGRWDDRQMSRRAQYMVRIYPEATIFCSWPSLNDPWFEETIRAMPIGQRLVVIREECCANDSAWDYLEDNFDRKQITLPCFEGLHDYAESCVKRSES